MPTPCPVPDQPTWIHKRDGRLVPFEADKISHSLFAASEALGEPNAFLARELTDGVLHFLRAEADGTIPTTGRVGEMVVKVVRELGQPALARAYAEFRRSSPVTGREVSPGHPVPTSDAPGDRGPSREELAGWLKSNEGLSAIIWRAGRSLVGEYAAREVFTRDLLAAQRDGWLTIAGRATAFELEGAVLGPPTSGDLVIERDIGASRKLVGGMVALDAAACGLAGESEMRAEDCENSQQRISVALQAAGLEAVLNFNGAQMSSWDGNPTLGPLFNEKRSSSDQSPLRAECLLDGWLCPSLRIRFHWHLDQASLAPEKVRRLTPAVRRALDGADLLFVFDRLGRPLSWAEGLSSTCPAVLATVGLHLPRLAKEIAGKARIDDFLQRLGSVARLAISAGRQKREFLRRHSPNRKLVGRGFLLDRASLVVVPVGIEAVCRHFFGSSTCRSGDALYFATQIIERLHDVLSHDGQASQLNVCLDSSADCALARPGLASASIAEIDLSEIAGITCWNIGAPITDQIQSSGALHSITQAGTAVVFLDDEESSMIECALDLLTYAFHHSDVQRIRLVKLHAAQKQMLASWAE